MFISYRHVSPDIELAREAANLLHEISIGTFLDEQDSCLRSAARAHDDRAVAKCIEEGLNTADALFGIVSSRTFESAWPPYEIGSARGRQKFFGTAAIELARELKYRGGTVSIAHLILGDVNTVPGFVLLGSPLDSLEQLAQWARLLHQVHGTKPPMDLDSKVRQTPAIEIKRNLQKLRDDRITFEPPEGSL